MKNLELIIPKFNPQNMAVGGVVAASVMSKQLVPNVTSSTISNIGENVDLESILLAAVVVGVCCYMLYQHLESRDRDRLYAY